MATIYKAYQPTLQRYVAAKVLKAQQALAPGFSEHLQREARAVVQLNLSNILPIYDFGQLEGLSYIAITLARHCETGWDGHWTWPRRFTSCSRRPPHGFTRTDGGCCIRTSGRPTCCWTICASHCAGGDGCRGGPAGLPLNAGRDQDVLEDGRGIGQALHGPRERYLLTLRAAQWGSEYGQHALLSEAE